MTTPPYLGFGLGLRKEHYQAILQEKPDIDFFEIISENYLIPGGKPLYYLDQIRAHYPIVMHGVSLSIGSVDPLDIGYLTAIKHLADRIQPAWISEHLCWTSVHKHNTHDLLPLPHLKDVVRHVSDRIQQVQDFLQRQILIENVSSYVRYEIDEMMEWDFLAQVTDRADCFILLDINNLFINSYNHSFDPQIYLENIPKHRVYQYHLAGHNQTKDALLDTHDATIIDAVWNLYQNACALFGKKVSTLIERDADIPPLNMLLEELARAREIARNILC